MKWYSDAYSNLAKVGTGITATSSDPYFPVANINGSPLACDVWRSAASGAGSGGTSEYLTIDLGGGYVAADYPNGLDLLIDSWTADQFCNGAIVAQLVGPSTLIVLSASPLTATAPIRFNLTLDASTPTTAVKLIFARRVADTAVQVGKILLGAAFDSGAQGSPDNAGFTRTFAELVNKDKSILGQSYSELRASFWAATIALPLVGEAIQAGIREYFLEAVGTHTPFWLIVNPDDTSTTQLGTPRYVKMTTPPTEKTVTYGAEQVWALSLSLEKQL